MNKHYPETEVVAIQHEIAYAALDGQADALKLGVPETPTLTTVNKQQEPWKTGRSREEILVDLRLSQRARKIRALRMRSLTLFLPKHSQSNVK